LSNFLLHSKDIREGAVVALGPEMGSGRGIYQLDVDAHSVNGAPNVAFNYVTRPKRMPNLAYVDVLAAKAEGRILGNDQEFAEAGQLRDDVLGDPVAKVDLIGIAAEVLEGQDGNHGLIGRGRL
jgi:hypothetical protein